MLDKSEALSSVLAKTQDEICGEGSLALLNRCITGRKIIAQKDQGERAQRSIVGIEL
jgi:hypothetical protein